MVSNSDKGDCGGACTYVVTEYRQALETQVQSFRAEIEFFNMEEIGNIIREHVEACREYHLNRQPELSEDELETASNDAETALKIFQALFADQEGFEGPERAQNFVRMAVQSSISEIVSKFVAWVKDLISRVGGEGGSIHRSSDTTENLAFELDNFLGTSPIFKDDHGEIVKASPSLWPVVKIVRISLDSRFLSQGLILADLPGMLHHVGFRCS